MKSMIFEESTFQRAIALENFVTANCANSQDGWHGWHSRVRNYFRNIPGMAPPILPISLDILPIFFIIVCI